MTVTYNASWDVEQTTGSYILSCVCLRLSIFIRLCVMRYMELFVFSLPIAFVMISRIFVLYLISITTSEIWIISHCQGLVHETVYAQNVLLSSWSYTCLIGDLTRKRDFVPFEKYILINITSHSFGGCYSYHPNSDHVFVYQIRHILHKKELSTPRTSQLRQ